MWAEVGGGGGGDRTCVNFYCISVFSHFSENITHTACSDSPCDTKSIKKLGVGDLSGEQAGDRSLRERGKDARERTDSSVENGERAGKARTEPFREGADFGDRWWLPSSRRVRPPRMLFGVRASGY